MTYDLFSALLLFAFVSSITPGPNNLMVMASGANFGFIRSIPHILGIALGFALMILLMGTGLAQVFAAYPASYDVLKVVSVLYLLYLSWKIANAAPVDAAHRGSKPLSFLQAAAFQWVNPKAWAMALTALAAYAPEATLNAFALVALVFGLICLPTVTLWTVLGQQVARFLTNPKRLRTFNWVMAALLVASLYPVLTDL